MKALVSRYEYFVNKTCLHNIIAVYVVVAGQFQRFLTVKVKRAVRNLNM